MLCGLGVGYCLLVVGHVGGVIEAGAVTAGHIKVAIVLKGEGEGCVCILGRGDLVEQPCHILAPGLEGCVGGLVAQLVPCVPNLVLGGEHEAVLHKGPVANGGAAVFG